MKSREGPDDGFADRLRHAIEERGVSLVWLRDRLADRGNRVSLTTLSYWRSGQRHPEGPASFAAIAEIEDLLGLPPGALARRAGPSRRTGPVPHPDIPDYEQVRRIAVEETLAALDAAPQTRLRDLSSQTVTEVDEHGRVRRNTTRALIQCTSGTIEELPVLEFSDVPFDTLPVPTNLAGMRLTRTHHHRSRQVIGWVFELEQPLVAPGTVMLDLTTEFPPDFPQMRESTYGVTRRNWDAVVWVRFHPDRLPVWCEEFADDGSDPVPRSLGSGTSVHAVRRHFGPGMFGLRWGFEPRE